jgi:hypothetical protein
MTHVMGFRLAPRWGSKGPGGSRGRTPGGPAAGLGTSTVTWENHLPSGSTTAAGGATSAAAGPGVASAAARVGSRMSPFVRWRDLGRATILLALAGVLALAVTLLCGCDGAGRGTARTAPGGEPAATRPADRTAIVIGPTAQVYRAPDASPVWTDITGSPAAQLLVTIAADPSRRFEPVQKGHVCCDMSIRDENDTMTASVFDQPLWLRVNRAYFRITAEELAPLCGEAE